MGVRHGGGGMSEQLGSPKRIAPLDNPWLQLVAGVVAMVAVANLQYGWTLFVPPLQTRFGWGATELQFTFFLFVLAETWPVPLEGYLADRLGPRRMVGLGGVLVGLAWVMNARADSLGLFYLWGVVGGVGTGIVYGTSIGNALKWFSHRRGLAAGITAAAFGAGSALTVFPMVNLIRRHGYEATFFWFGLGQGGVVLLCALLLRTPALRGLTPPARVAAGADAPRSAVVTYSGHDYTPWQVVRAPVFWLMYAMFTMVSAGGLLAIAQIAPMARDYKVADAPVYFLGLTMAALPLAMTLDRVLNGLSRPFFGWLSDHLGRANVMFLAFSLGGLAILLLINLAHRPLLFVLLTGLTFFTWGEVYSLFPALCADLFGRKFATTNYGMLYTAKGTAGLLVPFASYLKGETGSWVAVLALAVAFNWVSALLALLVLKPLCRRWATGRTRAETESTMKE